MRWLRQWYFRVERDLESGATTSLADRMLHAVVPVATTVTSTAQLARNMVRHGTAARAFHQLSADNTFGDVVPSVEAYNAQLPRSWLRPRPKPRPDSAPVPLRPVDPEGQLFEAIRGRRSGKSATSPPTIDELGLLLRYGCGQLPSPPDDAHVAESGVPGRAQPSGGGLYPVEAYVVIVGGAPASDPSPGAYHYDPVEHALRATSAADPDDLRRCVPRQPQHETFIVLTGRFAVGASKYGDVSYRLMALEAGHIGENVYLVASTLGLSCCGLGPGNVDTRRLNRLLGIDGVDESLLYLLAVGRPAPR